MTKPKQPRITIRCTPEEYALIEAKAGDQAVAAFVRDAALGKAVAKRKPTQRKVGVDAKSAAQILALLGSHPLVTAFKAAAGSVNDESEIAACHALLSEVRNLLLQSLGKQP
ncbi:hypothetical protein [uncultured Tateyamaria sp.]|uniref:plasmid mobilization protein n=1 Tax=uncultured Tateyamaria sp. TaxID=455651 RepID=UPI002611C334|nr:hypothetical protein [uncultured Tateyamaria sp.]